MYASHAVWQIHGMPRALHVMLLETMLLLCMWHTGLADQRHALGWKMAPATDTISTDRPSFSTGPLTVAPGHMQFEAGYQFTYDNDGAKTHTHTLPQLLFRLGLIEKLEFRVSWAGLSWTEVNNTHSHDASDMSLGFKLTLYEDEKLAFGLLGDLSIPVGTDGATSRQVNPSLGGLWTYDLLEDVGLFGTILLSAVRGVRAETVLETAIAVGVGFGLGPRLGSFVEYFGLVRDDRGPSHNILGGLTYVLLKNLQIDIHAGAGLNVRADDVSVGTGIAWRW